MSAVDERDAAQLLAEHLRSEGHQVLAHAVATEHGLLAVVTKLPSGWMFGHLRVSNGEPFRPPIGAFDDAARHRLRRQATAWFNNQRQLPHPAAVIRLDAFGVVLGAPAEFHHVPNAF